jgi:signal transduction histidine kinase
MTTEDEFPYSVALNINAPPSPEYTLELAEALAEVVRVLNHATRHQEALAEPADVHGVIQELSPAADRETQLLSQLAARLEAMRAAGGIAVPEGEYAGNPDLAVATARLRLGMAETIAGALREALDDVARVTSTLAAADTGEDGTDD